MIKETVVLRTARGKIVWREAEQKYLVLFWGMRQWGGWPFSKGYYAEAAQFLARRQPNG